MKKLLLLISSLCISSFIVAQPCVAITGFSVTPPSCFGLSDGAILVTYSAGIAPYDIQLIGPPNQSYTTSTLSQNMNGLGAGTYIVLISDGNGCQVSQPVNVNQPNPVSLFSVPDATICYGQSTQIAAFGSGGTPPYTYSWTPNTFVGGGPHTVNPTTTTNYTAELTDAMGCTATPNVITVNVTPSLSIVANAIYICDGDAAILTPTIVSPGNGGTYSYMWSTSETTNSITVIGSAPSGSTITTYTLLVDDGCTMPGAMTVFTVNANVCTGVKELNTTSALFYPNPSHDIINITSNDIMQAVELTSVTGKILLFEKVNSTSHQLQLQNFAEGIYFVKINYANGLCITKKIMKQ